MNSKHCRVERFDIIQLELISSWRGNDKNRCNIVRPLYNGKNHDSRCLFYLNCCTASETNGFIFFRLLRRVFICTQQETAKQLHHEENKRKCGWSTPQPCEFVDVSITLLVFSIASQKLFGWGLFSFQKIGALLVMEGQEGMMEA